ncbi:putative methyltransferase [Actinoplanes missouriensis 431]|uniref:Putative methyltransferase n=1 Tax=Actinoplanes missouriensis (strain ATCC 14538 / DSM 43046 / CBS 188.64 / JCM 3121 / NBRC 102363 / NCIMB 12654 / NRRL B-3342 / UNCC 431) TaxID=512565 RepID=I0HF79_ACTM4|nr:class I SAM-dependent methyltransferase [Actinoplanes missouriensis]BAL91666.1 putative methyltransferase [Actinoplanes missouriensis 431]
MTDYLDVNRANWDERAAPHAASPDYHVEDFATDPAYLSQVVRFDMPRLGDIAGLRGVHLQCHIGTDTISLSRLGATMTGLDFSGASVEQARAIAARAGADVTFVQSDVYAAREALDGEFDLVYTGIGALGWLPDITRWARTVASLLAPGGRLFIREGHPILWALDYDRTDGVIALSEPYFEHEEPQIYDEPGTYVTSDHQFQHTTTHEWNHGLGEIVTAVLDAGLTLTGLEEHQSVPWDALPGRMREIGGGEHQLIEKPSRLPHTYTLQARRLTN